MAGRAGGEMAGEGLARELTARAVQAARRLAGVSVLCFSARAADEAARIEGVERVLCAGDPLYARQLAEPTAALLASLAGGYTHILAPATTTARNILPRLAALLDVMVIPDVVAIIDAATFERPIYAGNAIQTVRSRDALRVLSVRTTAFDPAGSGGPAPVEEVAPAGDPALAQWIGEQAASSERPELTGAGIVVSGGRGLGSKEAFAMLERLADQLGAAVGASRAAVDSGYAPNDWQVGQTGKVVAPGLYIAVGLSGAIQHLAGMKDSRVIVAINRDEEAPIIQIADYALVADLFAVVPELIEKL